MTNEQKLMAENQAFADICTEIQYLSPAWTRIYCDCADGQLRYWDIDWSDEFEVLLCDNVLNFHGSDDSYYEEWWEDIREEGGWIAMLNTLEHVTKEMENVRLQYFVNVGNEFEDINWRKANPLQAYQEIDRMLNLKTKQLGY